MSEAKAVAMLTTTAEFIVDHVLPTAFGSLQKNARANRFRPTFY